MSHFVKIIDKPMSYYKKWKEKQLLKYVGGGRVNCPIGVLLDWNRGSTSSDASRLIHEIYPFFTI